MIFRTPAERANARLIRGKCPECKRPLLEITTNETIYLVCDVCIVFVPKAWLAN